MIQEYIEITVKNSNSPLSFMTEPEGKGNRYLAIGGKKALDIGNKCPTCDHWFRHIEDINVSIKSREISQSLNEGINRLSRDFLKKLNEIVPTGRYMVLLSEIMPSLVSKDSKNNYFYSERSKLLRRILFWEPKKEFQIRSNEESNYYRLQKSEPTIPIELFENHIHPQNEVARPEFYEFIIPTFSIKELDAAKVELYIEQLREGKIPTAVSISVLDIKGNHRHFSRKKPIRNHLILSHYLVEGHHKINAAAKTKLPVTLISYISEDQSIFPRKEIVKFVSELIS